MRTGAPVRLPELDSDTPLLVLRRAPDLMQHGVLGAARSLGRLGVRVYAGVLRDREPARRSRYLQGSLDLPHSGSDEEWVERLMRSDARLDGAVLVPIDDRACVILSDYQERLSSRFRLPPQPRGLHRSLSSKAELARVCGEVGLPSPAGSIPRSSAEALEHGAALGYPVVVKRIAAWFAPRDPRAPNVAVVADEAELAAAYRAMQAIEEENILLQEYIPGGPETIWMVNACFDTSSRPLCAFSGQKLRQGEAGPTTLGECSENQTVLGLAVRLMTAVGYCGIVDMGFRYDSRDGSYKLLDVNPRLGNSFRLFVASNGLDVLRALHLNLTGREVPVSPAQPGRRWVDEPHDVQSALRLMRAGDLTWRGWTRSLRGAPETAWWAADDPMPALAMTAGFPRWVASRRRARSSSWRARPSSRVS